MDGWKDGWMDAWMYVYMYICMYICMYVCHIFIRFTRYIYIYVYHIYIYYIYTHIYIYISHPGNGVPPYAGRKCTATHGHSTPNGNSPLEIAWNQTLVWLNLLWTCLEALEPSAFHDPVLAVWVAQDGSGCVPGHLELLKVDPLSQKLLSRFYLGRAARKLQAAILRTKPLLVLWRHRSTLYHS